jgi:dihydroceramidase
MSSGFWTSMGEAASIDWCEPNYVLTQYVAEWWNTISSLPMAALGLYGLWRAYRDPQAVEPRFRACFAALAMVGFGSAAFHAMLLRSAQALDELPMIYGSLVLLYCLILRRSEDAAQQRRWTIGLTTYAMVFTAFYGLIPDYFLWFVWTYGIIVTVLVIGSAKLALGPEGSQTHRRLVSVAAGSFVCAFALFWVPEHILLTCDHPAQSLHLHSWWHLLAGAGTYLGILFSMWDRLSHQGREPVCEFTIPGFVRPNATQ